MSSRLVSAVAVVAVCATTWLTVPASTATAAPPTCDGKPATIVSRHGEPVVGTDGPDVIVALQGGDIQGGAGDDVICTGGSSSISGGPGNDTIFGSPSGDSLSGDDGNDVLRGGKGDDDLSGGAGDDRLLGGSFGVDYFHADPGNDVWRAGPAHALEEDSVFPSHIFDFLDAATSGITVDMTTPGVSDGYAHGTVTSADFGHDRVSWALNAPPQVNGTPYDDTFVGGDENDWFHAEEGADAVSGGRGNDSLDHGTYPLTAIDDSPVGETHILGGPGADGIVDFSDTTVVTARGGPGGDTLFLDETNGRAWGDRGDDTIGGLFALGGQMSFSGGAGHDTASISLLPPGDGVSYGTVTLDIEAGSLSSSSGLDTPFTTTENVEIVDRVDPSSLVDRFVIRGDDTANRLTFSQIADTDTTPVSIRALGGDDVLRGGNGDDLLYGGAGHDAADGGTGHNTCISIEVPTWCA